MNATLPLGVVCLAAAIGIVTAAPVRETKVACTTDEDCAVLEEPAVCYQRVGGGQCEAGLPVAPSASVLNLALLGRKAAAADLVWMRTLQFIGAPWAEQVDYAGLEYWLELVTDLDPEFAHAYMIGGVLLATLPERAPQADALLQKAEKHVDDKRTLAQLAQWRGFVAYYGAFDPPRAAEHYQRAYDFGGPPMLRERARTLRARSADCRELWRSLSESVNAREHLVGGDMLNDRRRARILQNCFREQLNRALSVRRVSSKGDAKTIEELVDDGLIPAVPPTLEKGKCWMAIHAKAYIRPCQESTP